MTRTISSLMFGVLCAAATHLAFAETKLEHWPPEAAAKIDAMIEQNRGREHAYAVFDMDNTSYQFDITESLLPYLENKGVLTRENLDPALKLIPFKDAEGQPESLFSYYYRLCEIDDLVCYPWIAQSFAGLSLEELKRNVDEMLAEGKPVPAHYYDGDDYVEYEVEPPRLFAGMQELYNRLQENGIEVYVVTAANEEIVRMVASDPRYGYNVPPEHVIGVNTLLKDPESGELTTSRFAIRDGVYDQAASQRMVLTSYLVNPMTWFEGKLGTLYGWIDQWNKPVLVAGDTSGSDGYMLLNGTDVEQGGVRVWVTRSASHTERMREWRSRSAEQQREAGQQPSADLNWIEVAPEALH
ncbi:HAD family hydrolase [Halotalea alkalilenta]|uniref:HAD family hydrolase n=1 Tax=Halotalea alkalilenta TaxID=376489 RepID=UPI0005BDC08E|nr:HAD family hydrolase [Halotalea alkalilenta]